ncbi:hypothetical protein HJC23_003783 [Cyclotella cryptica]|uniref:Uncharacterized protein n=1 Tax=Cyclotella cryptica TaxID=29204 RepID=A0ABD3QV23_9STRA|eukprot:CCRYP_002232-RA/>CCRYP_002232-RA protein AED:0.01 eAED:0.01 QI:219/1/1/1/1/1/2/504/805
MSNKSNRRAPTQPTTAPLAIIDGTHLILLPNLNNPSPSAKDSKSHALDYAVPAIPLQDVPTLIGTHYISCLHEDNEYDAEHIAVVAEEHEKDDDVEIIEKIHINASDSSEYVGSVIRPVNLTRGGGGGGASPSSSISIRIWREEEADGASTYWSDDKKYLDVHLPVWGYCLDENYVCDDDDVQIYGEEYKEILHDYNDSVPKSKTNRRYFQIENAGSCVIADFLGIGGYQQLLVLPQLTGDSITSLQLDRTDSGEELFLQCSSAIRKILARSFLTDGYGILLSKQMELLDTKRRFEDSIVMTLPVLRLEVNFRESMKPLEAKAIDARKPNPEKLPIGNDENDRGSPMDVDTDNTNQGVDKSQEDPPWLKTLEKTIEHRISKKANEAAQVEKSNQICRDLVTHGRNTLHKAIRCGFDNNDNLYTKGVQDPQVVRIRYGMHPRSSTEASGISIVMDLEVDVYLHEIQPPSNHVQPPDNSNPDGASETAKESSCSSSVLHEFHVSCLMSDDYPDTSRNVPGVSCERIRTVSGSVPTFQPGECVTILASVYFTNLEMSLPGVHGECTTVDLTIQGYWVDGVSSAKRPYWNPADRQNRQGSILCILQLPEEIFFLSTFSPTSSSGGRCIQHEIDFVANATNHEKYLPMAIFEHREPRTLTIDISSGVSTFQDPKIWQDLVSSLNARIGLNSHIDLFWKTGDPRLRLVIFGSNAEERAATVKLVLRHLPESAKLILDDDPNEVLHAKELLLALQNEADAIKRHTSLPPNELTIDAHTEMAALQCATDGVASLIKRGWSPNSDCTSVEKSKG